MRIRLGFLLVLAVCCHTVSSQCSRTCDALASYYVWYGANLTFISQVLDSSVGTHRF
ncbi:unnamed protein product [Rhodiola kirilowii]